MVTDPSCGNHVTDEGRRLAEQHGASFLASNSREWGIGCTTEFFSKCWFSRFSSWQIQNFNPRGNRDRPLPQPVTTSHSSMHDLTSSSRDEMSSSLPAPPGPSLPHLTLTPPDRCHPRDLTPSRVFSRTRLCLRGCCLPPLPLPPSPLLLPSPPPFLALPRTRLGRRQCPRRSRYTQTLWRW
ncbi:hypothetical protein GBAR_LOCUS27280 [Geodia barretti]|uniref:Uncharacterized protein n=1 Tax=Geodia barretti TaxID=519541 RepID=A0AA35TKV1_GEOBA|nr:hypothetical protein GBAR_LOCUS27280 [Geodia barretti]